MKSEIIIAALGALLTGCATQAPKHVLFVGMDGMSGRSFQEGVAAPNIRALAERGSWTWRARSILPSSSAPNWASIFQCSGPELTGFVKWDTKEPVVPPPVTDANGRYPDFVARFRAANPSAKIGLAYEWDGIAHVLDTNACSFVRQGDCTETAVREYIGSARPDLMVVIFDRPDHTGHAKGWESPEYRAEVTRLDGFLGELLAAYGKAGMLDDTVVVVTSDHGGIDRKHEAATLNEMERPLVIAGPGIRRNREIGPGTLTTDTGATMARLLGVEPPETWTGRDIGEIFE